jgi:hypothetical protein
MRFAVSFERREGADVVNAPLFVERRHRLSSNDLSAGRSHCRITDIRVDHPDCALNHIPAVVDLGHNPIGFVLAVQRDSGAGPFGRRISGGLISKRITVPVQARHAGLAQVDRDAGHPQGVVWNAKPCLINRTRSTFWALGRL